MSSPSTPSDIPNQTIYFLSPQGDDRWSGLVSEPSADGIDGPLATFGGLMKRLRNRTDPTRTQSRALREETAIPGPIVVQMRGGRYAVTEPIRITSADEVPITFMPFANETPIIDGGQRLDGWEQTTLRGQRIFRTHVPEVANQQWRFRSLFVNGRRASRPRLPKQGLHTIDKVLLHSDQTRVGWGGEGNNRFRVAEGDFDASWSRPDEIDAVVLHYWIDERMPVEAYDASSRVLTSTRKSYAPLMKGWNAKPAPFYLDNVYEALTEPGEWYLEVDTGICWYLPRDGEALDDFEVYAPRARRLLQIEGEPSRPVSWLRFCGITFEHTDWVQPGDPEADDSDFTALDPRVGKASGLASAMQSAMAYPGVIRLRHAKHCSFTDCTVRHIGWYGLELAEGCQHCCVVGNHFYDIGAGGMKLDGSTLAPDDASPNATSDPRFAVPNRNRHHRITDNHLYDFGVIFHAGAGILAKYTTSTLIEHNHIHHGYYTGISVGWTWGYKQTVTSHNIIAYNHIHDLGQGLLSDLGGIYLLGPQPGTHVHHNRIHDITCAHYGGWAIYPDEGTSHVVIENNLGYRTDRSVFHQHYGRENIVRNNIFAFGGEGLVALSKAEPHLSFTFTRNILLSDGRPLVIGGYGFRIEQAQSIDSGPNLVWDYATPHEVIAGGNKADTAAALSDTIDWNQWQALGHDLLSIVADPGFADPKSGDFSLPADSPATSIGFRAFNLSNVGPRNPA